MDSLGKHVKVVLKEMCKVVGADYSSIDFKAAKWFWSHTWTTKQEQEFVKWLTNYLYKNAQARKEIIAYYWGNKKQCKAAAEEFAWNYGWKIIDP